MSNTFKAAVRGFKPSQHGFKFVNSFEMKDISRTIGWLGDQASQSRYGLCGGMAHCAYELFLHKESVPRLTAPPKPDTPLYAYLVGGLQDSFGSRLRDVKKMLQWHEMPDGKTRLPKLTEVELVKVKHQLERNKAVQLMICYHTEGEDHAFNNHQVLAYKIEEKDDEGKIFLYEPNGPNDNNAHITYSLTDKGVEMTEHYISGGGKSRIKKIHGFFVVFPRLENPMSKPAYILTKGNEFFVDRMRNNLRKGIHEITEDLQMWTNLSPLQIIKLLKESGYNATEIARICKDSLKLSAEATVNLLRKAAFTADQVVGALQIVFKKAAVWIVTKLIGLGFKAADVAVSVQRRFALRLLDLVKMLKRAKVSLREIVDILRTKFRMNNFRTLAKLLRSASFSITDIIGELKRKGLSMKDAVIILRREFRQSVTATAKLIQRHFGNKAKEILLALWKHGNASVGDMISAAKSAFNWSRLKLLKLI